MRGLSLTQPFASLIALGLKRIETRSWFTPYRGELLIHAALKCPSDCRAFADEEHEAGRLPAILPRGVIVAVARLVACQRTETLVSTLSAQERDYGDYGPFRFGWVLDDVRPLVVPVPCKGALGLWSVPQIVLDLVAGQGVLE